MSVESVLQASRGVGRTRSLLVAGVLVASSLVALAGCGYLEKADAAHEANGAEAIPRVEKPRNIVAVADRPCELLNPQQAAGFGLDRPPRQIPGTFGNVDCEWRSSTLDVWVYISIFTNRPTLEEVYNRRESLPYFELTRIGGYPAIMSRTEKDKDLPVCDIDVKPAERQSITVSFDSTEFSKQPQQSCVVGRRIAETVLSNLPPPG